jgi:diguanylate cyclase (GGDEF)-like protein
LNLVDTLSLKFKLYILLGIVVFGLLFSVFIGYFNMVTMKKNLDSLYFGSLVPVTELNQIQTAYNKGILVSFYQLQRHHIAPQEAAEKMDFSRQKILSIWNTYRSHFKRDNELAYIEFAHEEVLKSTGYLKRLIDLIISADLQDLNPRSSSILLNNITHMDNIFNKIITYENSVAQYERTKLLASYDATIYNLIAVLIFILSSVVIVMVPIFQSIHNNQVSLINASKKLQVANKRLETASITDALTELYNRRYFNLVYNRELTRAIREKQSLAFMMIDIDYFKGYNDYYGHLKGDAALKGVAKAMKETLKRPGDYLFRLGGEEFGVLISNIEEEQAYEMAERLRHTIEGLKIEHKKSKAGKHITISTGVVVLMPDKSTNPEIILQIADTNLYTAKSHGRNQVIITEVKEESSASLSA